jgi:ADP-ribose pyrophosphatase YjhB (NUDIX family)
VGAGDSVLFPRAGISAQTVTRDSSSASIDELADPEQLRERDDVPDTEVRRTLSEEPFEGLQEHYSSIDGVVQVGITTGDGELLLQGSAESGDWAPPGGAVSPGEDWVEAARRAMGTQTGVRIRIEAVERYEHLVFEHAENPQRQFSAPGVSFSATPREPPDRFLSDPEIVENPQLPEDHDRTFAWFDAVPEDARPNHVEHIEMFLD